MTRYDVSSSNLCANNASKNFKNQQFLNYLQLFLAISRCMQCSQNEWRHRWFPYPIKFCHIVWKLVPRYLQLNFSTTATLGTEESGHCREVETRVNVLDCEQSLFFFRSSESSARARKWRSGEPRETRVPLSSRAVRHAFGHLRVSRVLLDWLRKKRGCS